MKIGLSLSGGGFRATLYHLGVIKYLKQAKLLDKVRYISMVSGGSVIGAHMALNWAKYLDDSTFEVMLGDVFAFTRRDIRGRAMRRWPFSASCALVFTGSEWGMTGLLKRQLSSLYGDKTLIDLDNPDLLVEILGTSMSNGRPCAFRSDGGIFIDWSVMPNYTVDAPLTPLSLAVAASAAFPPLFPPVELSWKTLKKTEQQFPLSHYVTDGGIFDNLGMQVMEWTDSAENLGLTHVLMSDAGMPFDATYKSPYKNPLARQLRAFDVAMARNAELLLFTLKRNTQFYGKVIECRIDSVKLENLKKPEDRLHQQVVAMLPTVRTDFDKFSSVEAELLVRHGFLAAQKGFREFAAENVEPDIPAFHFSPPKLEFANAQNISANFRKSQNLPWTWDWSDWLSWCYAIAFTFAGLLGCYWLISPLAWILSRLSHVLEFLAKQLQ